MAEDDKQALVIMTKEMKKRKCHKKGTSIKSVLKNEDMGAVKCTPVDGSMLERPNGPGGRVGPLYPAGMPSNTPNVPLFQMGAPVSGGRGNGKDVVEVEEEINVAEERLEESVERKRARPKATARTALCHLLGVSNP